MIFGFLGIILYNEIQHNKGRATQNLSNLGSAFYSFSAKYFSQGGARNTCKMSERALFKL